MGALVLLREAPSVYFWVAAALMGAGLWLHLTEHHEHEYDHDEIAFTHRHVHDDHHLHERFLPQLANAVGVTAWGYGLLVFLLGKFDIQL